VTHILYNRIRSKAMWRMKRTAKGESKGVPDMCFMT